MASTIGPHEPTDAWAIVIDIGKTVAKVTLWSRDGLLVDRKVRPNLRWEADGIARLDVDGIAEWLMGALGDYAGKGVSFIIPVGHGAAFAALSGDALAFPPIDYEATPPAAISAGYGQRRASFAQTGSPRLPDGLNFGAQLAWVEASDPHALEGTVLVPWAQYWAWWLTGHAASEVSSLGCHSDLWAPAAGTWSSLALEAGWAGRFAPLAGAGTVIGRLRPELAAATGLSDDIQVAAGLHDSNAALVAARGHPELADGEATVLSTGTWFIAMRMDAAGCDPESLPAHRDCLVNISPSGMPVPSVRFMGGREIEMLVGDAIAGIDQPAEQPILLDAAGRVVSAQAMHLPTLAPGCGPFPDGVPRWLNEPTDRPERLAAACLYAALVADAALDLIGSRRRILVEGRFARSDVFVRALAALRPDTQVFVGDGASDVSFGALRLLDAGLRPSGSLRQVEPLPGDLDAYRSEWRVALIRDGEAVHDHR